MFGFCKLWNRGFEVKKLKRSARLVEMTHYLLSKPNVLVPLTFFAERYDAAKSSISEDLTIIKDVFETGGHGVLYTLAGAAGGVKFVPRLPREEAVRLMNDICRQLEQPERLLPGGYLYMSDLLGQPSIMNEVGRAFASKFGERPIDVVMTVETKGIPLAYATAAHLNLPVVIVRRAPKGGEGGRTSIPGSSQFITIRALSPRKAQRLTPGRTTSRGSSVHL